MAWLHRTLFVTVVLLAACCPTAVAAGATSGPPAEVPAQLQASEQRMAALRINSESFTIDSEITSEITTITKKFGKRRVKHRSVKHSVGHLLGSASLSPNVSWEREHGRLTEIQIGANAYHYSPEEAKIDGGRPWVETGTSALGEPSLFPGHGRSVLEAKGPGRGPYAGLLNLLATAVGTIAVLGPTTVDGQATTGFALTVRPASILTVKASPPALLEQLYPPQLLEVFVTEVGVPVRVVDHVRSEFNPDGESHLGPEVIGAAEGSFSGFDSGLVTTDITALEPVVRVKPPPRHLTRKLKKLLGSGGQIHAAGSTPAHRRQSTQ